ncbi:glutamate--cysteine ligase [Streptomyces sp. ST2-7A]|uniref:carboxylate-amine ligase n=1 Tax=Streptomyces sp. ST2-7A TaxID=2907214 RepID=UPI001F40BE72|nr:glutamate--cysteine ligase [Streptomyces sp. ST2-7A]MCE7081658.1 glutamate--cysteine ligase [Streptomyces sp. ST2-7A]
MTTTRGSTATTVAPRPVSSSTPGDALTVGVEEEFLLVDPRTARTSPACARVLARVEADPPPAGGCRPELHATQVEASTGVCTDLNGDRGVAGQLSGLRSRLAAAAREEDVLLVPSGTPVLGGGGPHITPEDRYERIAAHYAGAMEHYEMCGCHVHVGVPDEETAVAVVNRLRPWLPVLLALSANSPLHRGRDRGFASWRIAEEVRFPGAGLPPWFDSAAHHRAVLDRMVETGALADHGMTFWLARPSSRYPTVEVRVADTAATVDEAVLQAGLVRALVRTALTELEAGAATPRPDDQEAAAALWSAARHGLGGSLVHPRTGRLVPAREAVDALLASVTPALEGSGDLLPVRSLLDAVLAGGTGADRQRAAWREGGPGAVVGMLAVRTGGGSGAAPTPGDPRTTVPPEERPRTPEPSDPGSADGAPAVRPTPTPAAPPEPEARREDSPSPFHFDPATPSRAQEPPHA